MKRFPIAVFAALCVAFAHPAVASATPTTLLAEDGSVGTTSHSVSLNRSVSSFANCMHAAIGCSSRNVISRSESASETSRWAVGRDTLSLRAISSWVLPPMK